MSAITITIAREALDDGSPGYVVRLGSLELLARSEEDAAKFASNLAVSIAVHTVEEVRIQSAAPRKPRFAETWCSQCGAGFGPGDHGYSHCADHTKTEG